MYMKAAATLHKMFGGSRVPSTTSSVSGSRIFALALLCNTSLSAKSAENVALFCYSDGIPSDAGEVQPAMLLLDLQHEDFFWYRHANSALACTCIWHCCTESTKVNSVIIILTCEGTSVRSLVRFKASRKLGCNRRSKLSSLQRSGKQRLSLEPRRMAGAVLSAREQA